MYLFLMVSELNKIYTNLGTKTQNSHLLPRALGFYGRRDDGWEVGPVSPWWTVLRAGIRRRGAGEFVFARAAVRRVGSFLLFSPVTGENDGVDKHTKSSEQRGEAREGEVGCRGGVVWHSVPFYREGR